MGTSEVAQVLGTEAHGWCAARGLSRVRSLWVVLASNAWGESAWNPRAIQPNGGGRGLFQCDVDGGLGKVWIQAGGSEAQLLDATVNTRLILWEAGRASRFVSALSGGTLGDAVDAFVRYVERPKYPDTDSEKRQAFARHFAGGASMSTTCRTFG